MGKVLSTKHLIPALSPLISISPALPTPLYLLPESFPKRGRRPRLGEISKSCERNSSWKKISKAIWTGSLRQKTSTLRMRMKAWMRRDPETVSSHLSVFGLGSGKARRQQQVDNNKNVYHQPFFTAHSLSFWINICLIDCIICYSAVSHK